MYIHRMATKLQEMIESLPFGRWTNAQEERLKFLLHFPLFLNEIPVIPQKGNWTNGS